MFPLCRSSEGSPRASWWQKAMPQLWEAGAQRPPSAWPLIQAAEETPRVFIQQRSACSHPVDLSYFCGSKNQETRCPFKCQYSSCSHLQKRLSKERKPTQVIQRLMEFVRPDCCRGFFLLRFVFSGSTGDGVS